MKFTTFLIRLAISIGIVFVSFMIAPKVKRFVMNFDKHPQDLGAMTFLGSAVSLSVKGIGMIVALGQLGVDTSVIVGAFSAVGLGISLALKNNMANVAGGIQIILTKPFNIGDFIEIGTYSGTVQTIDTMFTTLVSPNRQVIVVPNANIISDIVVNYSREETRRMKIDLSVSNTTDTQALIARFDSLMKEEPLILDDPAPYAKVIGFLPEGNGIMISCFAFSKTPDYWNALYALNLKLHQCLDEMHVQQPTDSLQIKSDQTS